ncbi:MAG: Gfo/Idh/MocA family protein [Nevskiales bacterium]
MTKVAVIGAGHWGRNLIRNLHEMGVLAAVAEHHADVRQTLAETYPDLSLHPDPAAIFGDASIRGVLISTPSPTHYQVAKQALLAGKDVLVEKPMTLNSRDAKDLVTLAKQQSRVLMTGHLLLFQPAVRWIKQFLDDGKLGNLCSLHQERMDLGRAQPVENVLWALGVHDLAVLLYLVGAQPERIRASGHHVLTPDVEDDVYVHMEFPNGVRANLHNSWLWPVKRRRLVVVGSTGMLVYNEVKQSVVHYRKSIGSDLRNRDEGSELVFEGHGQPLRLELEHFLECVKTRATPLASGESAIEVIKVLEAAAGMLEN